MDFSYNEDQQALIDLAAQIFADNATHERQRALEKGGAGRFDRALWDTLAEAGLLAVSLPEQYGGSGLGVLEACSVAEQVGRKTAPVPYVECAAVAGPMIALLGGDEVKERVLPALASGKTIVTVGLVEDGAPPEEPTARAVKTADGYTISGTKLCVPFAEMADAVIVAASSDDGIVVALVDTSAAGVTTSPLDTTSGQPESELSLDEVPVATASVLAEGESGRDALATILDHARTAQTSMLLGVCSAALELTAEYIKERKQFGQAIAMFQSVAHRAADAYVDVEAIRLATLQAMWRLDAGVPASAEIALAKYWAAEGGQRVVHAAQHLHGGVGVDRDYPLHRYFLYAKQLELALGGASDQLRTIGAMIAAGTA